MGTMAAAGASWLPPPHKPNIWIPDSRSASDPERPRTKQLLYEAWLGNMSLTQVEAVKSRPRRNAVPAVPAVAWHAGLRCAFTTLLITRPDARQYASFLEAATRAREAFALERAYPHVAFHEDDLPEAHKRHMRARVPSLRFEDVTPHFGAPDWLPDRSAWRGNDRSVGYKNMCRFYGLRVFGVMRDLGIDAFLRVDDDVFFLDRVDYDPFRYLYESGAVYVYGVAHPEQHEMTAVTLQGWGHAYCETLDRRGDEDCWDVTARSFTEMYFNNFFGTRTDFWATDDVLRFQAEVDASSNIYVFRWGDAPIQSLAVNLFADPGSVSRLPRLAYAHYSGKQVVRHDNAVTDYHDRATADFIKGLPYLGADNSTDGPGDLATAAAAAHEATWLGDLAALGFDFESYVARLRGEVDRADALLYVAQSLGVHCVGSRGADLLVPRYCCCHLASATFRDPDLLRRAFDLGASKALERLDLGAVFARTAPLPRVGTWADFYAAPAAWVARLFASDDRRRTLAARRRKAARRAARRAAAPPRRPRRRRGFFDALFAPKEPPPPPTPRPTPRPRAETRRSDAETRERRAALAERTRTALAEHNIRGARPRRPRDTDGTP